MTASSPRAPKRTPGQVAYERDCDLVPAYSDGAPRKMWAELGAVERASWERNPTPRWTAPPTPRWTAPRPGRDARGKSR